jgi:hypothetical protein
MVLCSTSLAEKRIIAASHESREGHVNDETTASGYLLSELDRAPDGPTRFTPGPIGSALAMAFTEDGALRRPFRLLAAPVAMTAALAAAVVARRAEGAAPQPIHGLAPSYQSRSTSYL